MVNWIFDTQCHAPHLSQYVGVSNVLRGIQGELALKKCEQPVK